MKLMTTACAAALCLGLLGASGAAQAQSYDDIIVFGDSLSDNGNLALFAAQPPPPYFGGRFSDGVVWVEQLGFGPLGGFGDITDSVDWAFGGAWTSVNANPPPMTTQVASYIGSGGTFQSDDLVTLWGGANNIFNNILAASITPNPTGTMQTVGALAANDIGSLVNQVANAGAGTILVPNLPTLSLTPSFSSSPAAPLADAGVNGFNATLRTNLFAQAAAHPNTNIILMDVNTAGSFLAANAARFGFTNVTTVCFNGITVCASPSTTFYWDSVHPTTAGHAFIAALATEYLYYGDFSVPTAAEGETALRHRAQASDAVFGRIGSGAFDTDRTGVSIVVDAEQATADARGLMPETEDDSTSFRIVLEHVQSETLMWGGQFSATRSEVETGPLEFTSESFAFDGYLGWRSGGGMFLNAMIGGSQDNYRDINRLTAVPTVVNDSTTEGSTWSAKLQGGWIFDMGGVSVSPRAAIGYVSTTVEGYTEDGPMVRQVIHDRTIEAVTAEAAIRFEGDLGSNIHAFLEAGYRDNLDYSADDVTASLADNPALPLSTQIGEADGGMGMVDAGLAADLAENISVGVGYRGRMGDQLDSHMGRLSVNLRF